ncbi:methyl-accepting chemotaxis protein [Vibrio coralliilyticus]|uniref:methyl-accepting chemotaxis protein n=1 Tax=Vibrio TaxID=662 RepID=UPI000502828E|nr:MULTISPECIES: methyl-accepting chemotaxis protein [Vibrio]KFI09468.1 chemotaxis protein [Vibrio sp. B183]NOI21138.1 methyl-accepting chemotaxis protein [Vibrio coralliilyticus]
MNLSDLSFKQKVALLITFPIVSFLWLSTSTLFQNFSTSAEMSSLIRLTNLSVVYSDLVHELQKERGMTAGFLSSNGTNFQNELASQRSSTNQKKEKLSSYLNSHPIENTTVQQLNDKITQQLRQLKNIRSQVDNQSIPLSNALQYYTQANRFLLSISGVISDISTDSAITKETIAYYNFLQGKERAGIERAVLNGVFSNNEADSKTLIKFASLVTQQDTYLSNFLSFARSSNKQFYETQMNDSSVTEVTKLRKLVMSRSTDFNIDPKYWFNQATKRIGQLKKTEDYIADQLIELASKKASTAKSDLVLNLILCSFITVMTSIICFLVIKDLSKRVKDLTKVMESVKEGNDLTSRATYVDKSELGVISYSLNATLERFHNVIDNLSGSSVTLASSAEQTSQTCHQNSSSILEQQNQIGLIATAIEQLSATVDEVASKTQQTAESAKTMNGEAKNGLTTVKASYQSIDNLAQEINELAQKVTHLHESSNNITSVIDVIKSVADQTNLLALNAAIEAARAGEQGRGFAVVADEVRSLAQRTQDSTSEIEGFITSLQADVEAAFSVIDSCQEKSASAVASSQLVEQTLSTIATSVSDIFNMTDQIATATEEQAVVTQDIAKNVVSVEEASTHATTGASQIASTAQEQAQLASSLKSLAATFKIS